jgi:hypothetical protein
MQQFNLIFNSIQSTMLISIAISAIIMGVHRFFIGEFVDYETPLFPFYKNFLLSLRDKYEVGQSWAIIYKPLGGCLYCFAFWLSMPICIILSYHYNLLFLPMPFFIALVSSILNKALTQ